MIWNQTDFRLAPNQAENGVYNKISDSCWIAPEIDYNYHFPSDFRFAPNQSENGKYNQIWVDLARIGSRFPCACVEPFDGKKNCVCQTAARTFVWNFYRFPRGSRHRGGSIKGPLKPFQHLTDSMVSRGWRDVLNRAPHGTGRLKPLARPV